METPNVDTPVSRVTRSSSNRPVINAIIRPASLADRIREVLTRDDRMMIDVAIGVVGRKEVHLIVVPVGEQIPFRAGVPYVESVGPFGDLIASAHGNDGRLLTVRGKDVRPEDFFPSLSPFIEAVDGLLHLPDKKMPVVIRRPRHFAAPLEGQTQYVYTHRDSKVPVELMLALDERGRAKGRPTAFGVLNHRFAAATVDDQFMLVSCSNPPKATEHGHTLVPVDQCTLGFIPKYVSDALWPGKVRDQADTQQWYHIVTGATRLAIVRVLKPHRVTVPTCSVVIDLPLSGHPGAPLDLIEGGNYLVRSQQTGGLSLCSFAALAAALPPGAKQILQSVSSF